MFICYVMKNTQFVLIIKWISFINKLLDFNIDIRTLNV